MRWWATMVVLAALEASTAAGEPTTLDEALAASKRRGRPVVVELTATWCGPCKTFEADILPAPAVQTALQRVVFVRLDVDEDHGEAVSERYATSAVPTFLVLDSDGTELSRTAGLVAGGANGFVIWLHDATALSRSERDIDRALAASPTDPAVLAAAAQWYRARGRRRDAAAMYERAAAADPTNAHDVGADAAWRARRLRLAQARRDAEIADAADYVTRYPGTARAAQALTLAVFSGDVPDKRARALVALHLAELNVDRDDHYHAGYAALAVGLDDAAVDVATRLIAEHPRWMWSYLLMSDAYVHAGAWNAALTAARRCQHYSPKAREDQCLDQKRRLYRKRAVPSSMLAHYRRQVQRHFANLETPGSDGDQQRRRLDKAKRDARGDSVFARHFDRRRNVFTDVANTCATYNRDHDLVYVIIKFGRGGRRPSEVAVIYPDIDDDLRECLERELGKANFAPIPNVLRNRGTPYPSAIRFAKDQRTGPTGPKAKAQRRRSSP